MADQDPSAHTFDVTILKNKSGSDTAQVPASATVKLLEPGATVKTGTTVPVTANDPDPQPTSVEVYDSSTLPPQQLLDVNAAATNRLLVAAPPGRHTCPVDERHRVGGHAQPG